MEKKEQYTIVLLVMVPLAELVACSLQVVELRRAVALEQESGAAGADDGCRSSCGSRTPLMLTTMAWLGPLAC